MHQILCKHFHCVTPVNSQKANQNPTPIYDKSLGKIRNSRPIPKHIKAIYSKPVVNIKLNEEKL
jgi:hypothetical protein